MNIETLILRNLIQDENYTKTVIPHLLPKYFDPAHKIVFTEIAKFATEYNKMPNTEALNIELQKNGEIPAEVLPEVFAIAGSIDTVIKDTNPEWLINQTEKWCQDKSIYLAIMESINIIDGNHESLTKNALPE
jgi:replicative DNA helicase